MYNFLIWVQKVSCSPRYEHKPHTHNSCMVVNITRDKDLRSLFQSILVKSLTATTANSWGADVESPYRISGEEDHEISFIIQ